MVSNNTKWPGKRKSKRVQSATTSNIPSHSELEDVAWLCTFQLLHLLPPDQREILRHADLTGVPIHVIAANRGIPPEEVVRVLKIARKTLCDLFRIAPLFIPRPKKSRVELDANRVITRLFGSNTPY